MFPSFLVPVEPACCRQWPHSSSLWLSSGVWLWGRWLRGEFAHFHQLLRLGWGAGLSGPGPLGTTFQQVGWPVHRRDRGGRWHRNTARKNRMGLTCPCVFIDRPRQIHLPKVLGVLCDLFLLPSVAFFRLRCSCSVHVPFLAFLACSLHWLVAGTCG